MIFCSRSPVVLTVTGCPSEPTQTLPGVNRHKKKLESSEALQAASGVECYRLRNDEREEQPRARARP